MEALGELLASPIEALGNAAAAAVGADTLAEPAGAAAPQVNATFTEDTLRMLLYNLFHGDSRLQQQTLQQFYAPDIEFRLNEGLLELTGRDALQQFLRGCQLLASFKPEVVTISSGPDKAVVLLNLNISYKLLPLTWWARIPLTSTITLHFGRPDPAAAASAAATAAALVTFDDVITRHEQELSLLDVVWWNPAWEWVNARLWARLSGPLLSKVVRFEEPLVSKHLKYLAAGAGLVQAWLWSCQDLAEALGLQPAVSALSTSARDRMAAAAAGAAAAAKPSGATAAAGRDESGRAGQRVQQKASAGGSDAVAGVTG